MTAPTPLSPVFLLGTTGSGKSRLAVQLAEALGSGAEIVSADAYQVYRAMPILTAAPEAELLHRVPHHLVGTHEVWQENNAAEHARRAQEIIGAIQARGHRPIVVGGSGLYAKFISHGISPAPPSDPELMARITAMPLQEAVARLQELDPEGAAATDLHNPRYVARNLEIVLAGGKPLSAWHGNWEHPAAGPGFLLTMETKRLDSLLAMRARRMLQTGVVQEVAALPHYLSLTARKTLGLREVQAHLAGNLSEDALEVALTLATRRYAKRQRTWLRRETWLTPIPAGPTASDNILCALENSGAGARQLR